MNHAFLDVVEALESSNDTHEYFEDLTLRSFRIDLKPIWRRLAILVRASPRLRGLQPTFERFRIWVEDDVASSRAPSSVPASEDVEMTDAASGASSPPKRRRADTAGNTLPAPRTLPATTSATSASSTRKVDPATGLVPDSELSEQELRARQASRRFPELPSPPDGGVWRAFPVTASQVTQLTGPDRVSALVRAVHESC